MPKHFESDVSRSLSALVKYYYKPPDIMQAGMTKVDFLGCYMGRFFAIEAKEVTSPRSCPVSQFSPGQRACLDSVTDAGGLAIVLINYGRRGRSGDRGRALAFPVWNWNRPFLSDDDEAIEVLPVTPGKWNLEQMFKEVARSAKLSLDYHGRPFPVE